jgi:Protein of unknown function (DUF1566)
VNRSRPLKTDQKECYNESGHLVPCAGSGQDAESKRNMEDQTARFEVYDDVVTDLATGLVWDQNANPATFPMSWTEAFEYIDGLNRSGYNGIVNWRLPCRRELFSLISHQQINPALPDGHPFTDVFSGYYWTSSTCRRLTDQAWYIHLGGGRIYRGMKYGAYMLWPVTGPQLDEEQMSNRFLIENGTLQDRLTNRVWIRPLDAVERPVKWEKALEAIDVLNAQNACGYADWRLPNIRELASLVDLNCHSPALPVDHPFGHVAEGYWSSITSVYEKRYAWVLYPCDGAVGVGYKPLPEFCAWAVRCDCGLNSGS